MNKIKPISPDEVTAQKIHDIPDEVIEVWNRIISRNYCGKNTRILQEHVIDELMPLSNFDRSAIFHKGWLDVEDIYRAHGWEVEYDKPGYNESYDAFWVFSKKSRG